MRRRRSRTRAAGRRSGLPKVERAARVAAAHRHTDAGPDQVVCLLCGETYRAINYTHLTRVHGLEGGHPVRDYKERFGLRVACCQEICEHARDVQILRYERAGRHWTRVRILREIQKRSRSEHALAHSRAPVGLTIAARRMFGTWDAALGAAGIDPMEHRFKKAWDLKRLSTAIRGHAKGGRSVTASWVKAEDPALHRAAIRLVGNWTSAIRAAGLDVRAHREPKRWSMDRVVEWVRRTHACGGDLRASRAPGGAQDRARKERGLPWSAFIESLGIPYPGRKKRLDWTDAAVLRAIRARRRAGLPLNPEAVVRELGQGLCRQARGRFGSWEAAVKAAGIDPRRAGVRRRWTREIVVAEIRARRSQGKSLGRREALADARALVQAAERIFPSGWGRAVAAAGPVVPGHREGGGRKPRRRKGR